VDGDERFLKLRKSRYEPMVREMRAETRRHTIAVVDDQGELQDMALTYTIPMESNQDERIQLRQAAMDEEEQLRKSQLADECHTEFLKYASQFQNPVIYVGLGNRATPANCERIKLREWLASSGIKGMGNNLARVEMARMLMERMGQPDKDGFVWVHGGAGGA